MIESIRHIAFYLLLASLSLLSAQFIFLNILHIEKDIVHEHMMDMEESSESSEESEKEKTKEIDDLISHSSSIYIGLPVSSILDLHFFVPLPEVYQSVPDLPPEC